MYLDSIAVLGLVIWIGYLLWRVSQLKTHIITNIAPSLKETEERLIRASNTNIEIAKDYIEALYILHLEMACRIIETSESRDDSRAVKQLIDVLTDRIVDTIGLFADKSIYVSDGMVIEKLIPGMSMLRIISCLDDNCNIKSAQGLKTLLCTFYTHDFVNAFRKESKDYTGKSLRKKRARKV